MEHKPSDWTKRLCKEGFGAYYLRAEGKFCQWPRSPFCKSTPYGKIVAPDIKPVIDPYAFGIQSDRIYHLKGDKIQMFLWLMAKFYEAGKDSDKECLEMIKTALKERIEEWNKREVW